MKEMKIVYLPVGVPTFHMESAHEQFTQSVKMLQKLYAPCLSPAAPLVDLGALQAFLHTLRPDLIILQNTTFAHAAYAAEVAKYCSCPILLWTLREPVVDGGRLRLNSLTGAYSAANLLHQMHRENFIYVFGAPDEHEVVSTIQAAIRALEIKEKLRQLKVAAIGHTPPGFGFGRALDAELLSVFGINQLSIEARDLMKQAKSYQKEDYEDLLALSHSRMIGLQQQTAENVDAYLRLYKAYKDYIEKNNIQAIASRCWPDFFTDYGTPVCSVLGMLNDDRVAAACEADMLGAISMYIGMELSHKAVFFGDPVHVDESSNSITYWHCGMAACSLAQKVSGAEIGVHPNRQMGPAMDFACRAAEKVTIFRLGRTVDARFRFLIATGEALDVPKQFSGTSVVVRTDSDVMRFVNKSVKDGWEPHFIVIYADVVQELEMLATLLHLPVCRY